MKNEKPIPYAGNEKYIFVSYSHKDAERVLPVISKLKENGYRVWYDDEIDPGSEWPIIIGEHVMACEVFFAFISKNYTKSRNCKRELTLAQNESKEFVAIYLEEVELDPGMKLQLSVEQSVFLYKATNKEVFYNKLFSTVGIEACKSIKEAGKRTEEVRKSTKEEKTEELEDWDGSFELEDDLQAILDKMETVHYDPEDIEKITSVELSYEDILRIFNDEPPKKEPVKKEPPKKEPPKAEFPKEIIQEENGVKTWNNLLEYELKKNSKETYVVITGFSKKNTSIHEINMPQFIQGYPVREVEIVQKGSTWFSSVVVPEGVKQVSFAGCTNIQSVTLPNSIYKLNYDAFKSCDNLTDIHFPDHPVYYDGSLIGLSPSMRRKLNQNLYPVLGGTLLEIKDELEGDIVIPEGVTYINSSCFRIFSKAKDKITSISFPGSLECVERGTFEKCSKLEKVFFQNGIKSISAAAFRDCPELKEARIPKNTEVAKDAFFNCPKVRITRY